MCTHKEKKYNLLCILCALVYTLWITGWGWYIKYFKNRIFRMKILIGFYIRNTYGLLLAEPQSSILNSSDSGNIYFSFKMSIVYIY